MRELLFSIASPETLSWIGFLLLAFGLLGEVAIFVIPTNRHTLHSLLGLGFAAIVLIGYVTGHIGDDVIFDQVKERAEKAERRLADRKLSDQQVAKIAGKLKEYSGQEYEIIAFWNNKESVALMNRMISALDLAQWKQFKPDSQGLLFPGLIGVQVWVRPPTSEKTMGAARALVSVLKGEVLEAEL